MGLMTRGSLLLQESAMSRAETENGLEDGLENIHYSVI